ncbi:Biogenesis of lysosome-related organelles complex 1 subunit 4 [Halotydeus destructor]|nr:Biogenesis of lysosome-related organelles complex 1 subunit 4 [Halotydeus destructor]
MEALEADLHDVQLSRMESTDEKEALDELASKLSSDYGKFFTVDPSQERKTLTESVEENLAHLEEYCGLLDVIREDNTQCFEHMLPSLYQEALHLDNLYSEIDRLEQAILVVKRTVLKMETEVENAEKLLSSQNAVKKIFSTLFGSSRKSVHRRPKYVEPPLFNTAELFRPKQEQISKTDSDQ